MNEKVNKESTEYAENSKKILSKKTLSDDEKLFLVFQEYKEAIKGSQLYYALLGWKDAHNNELKHLIIDINDIKGKTIPNDTIQHEIDILINPKPPTMIIFSLNVNDDYMKRLNLAMKVLNSITFPVNFCATKNTTELEKRCIKNMMTRYNFTAKTISELTGRSYSTVVNICKDVKKSWDSDIK